MKKFKTVAVTLLVVAAATNLFCLSANSNNQKCRNLLSRMLSFNIPAYAEGPGAGIFGTTGPYERINEGLQACSQLHSGIEPISASFSMKSTKYVNLMNCFNLPMIERLVYGHQYWVGTGKHHAANKGVRIDTYNNYTQTMTGQYFIDVRSVNLYKIGCDKQGIVPCKRIDNPCQNLVDQIVNEFSYCFD